MKKYYAWILVIIFVLSMVFIKPWKWHLNVHHSHKSLSQMLELNSTQLEYEKMLRSENQKELKPILFKLEKSTKIYKKLLKDRADSVLILAQKKKIDNLYKKYNEIQKLHMKQFENILTDEQKQKFKLIRAQLFLKD
jgi:Spy/CpxP family protein refolding chaperone